MLRGVLAIRGQAAARGYGFIAVEGREDDVFVLGSEVTDEVSPARAGHPVCQRLRMYPLTATPPRMNATIVNRNLWSAPTAAMTAATKPTIAASTPPMSRATNSTVSISTPPN